MRIRKKSHVPFADMTYGVLIHRIKYVDYWGFGNHYKFYCGNGGTKAYVMPIKTVPRGRYVCARCEALATRAEGKSSSAIVGRRIRVGRAFKAVKSVMQSGLRTRPGRP